MPDERPRPRPTPTSRPFWDALREQRVVLQRCDDCAAWVYYPRVRCPECLSDRLTWRDVDAAGHVLTFTIARQPTAPAFAEDVPQVLAIVELDVGVRMSTTLVVDEPDLVEIGDRVEPVFDRLDDATTLLRFRVVG